MSQIELTTLGKSCEFFNGKAHEKSIDENGQYIVVNSKFISSEGKSFKRTNEQMFPLYKGDIVMVMSDVPNGKALAKCFIIDKDDTYSLNQRICCIRSNKFDTKYLYYQLNRHEHFLAFNNSENQTNLRKDDILACPLIKPSMEEQQRIVSILDEAFAAIDQAKANAEQNLKNAKELFDGYLQSVFENQGDDWEEKKLGEVIKLEYGKPLDETKRKSNGKYPMYGANGIKGRTDEYYHDKKSIIVGRKGSAGEINLTENKFWPLDVTYFVTFDEKIYDLMFLYFLLSRFDLPKLAKGVKPGINRNEVYEIQALFPSLEEQQTIVRQLDTLRAKTQKLEEIYQRKIADLEELKKSMLQKAFAGEL
uniref:Specificity determinant HsdS-like protein n=1 Tax=Chlorobium chlorochromatii (strain CaD3) TaxID=340177 RepID=Q3ASF1_CHLCH